MTRVARVLLLGAGFVMLPWFLVGQSVDSSAPRLRRPSALVLVEGGQKLLIANRDSGTLAVLDTSTRKVISETKIGRKLAGLAINPAGDHLLVADEEAGELITLSYRHGTMREVGRRQVGRSPVSVQIAGDGTHAVVACLWSRRLVILELASLFRTAAPGDRPPVVLDLAFAPRLQLATPGTSKVIVADAFGGKLAVVDTSRSKLESVRDLNVHNIRGLSVSPDGKGLWLTHQVLHAQGHTTPGDIRTGNLLTNNVRRLALASVLDPLADVLGNERSYSLGDVERGAGDPADVTEIASGRLLVAQAGVNELAIGQPELGLWTRLELGSRPTAIVVDAERGLGYVANTFGDSISVVSLQEPKVVATIRLGVPAVLKDEERGELLFFDARLSFESWFSCHSCHTDGHTSGRLNDNFTDGSFGTPKRILSLLGAKDTGPWAWNGRMMDLKSQVRTSLKSTMQGPTPTANQVRELTAYLNTLAAPPSVATARGTVDEVAVKRGRKVFSRQKCATCHTPPTYTSPKTYDVGLRDEVGGSQFNPPSLRGVSQGGPYFHDNRAVSLEDVLKRYNHELFGKLPEQDLTDLLTFLRSL